MIPSLFVKAKSATSSKQNRRHQSSNPAPVHKNPETDRPSLDIIVQSKIFLLVHSAKKVRQKRVGKPIPLEKKKKGKKKRGFQKRQKTRSVLSFWLSSWFAGKDSDEALGRDKQASKQVSGLSLAVPGIQPRVWRTRVYTYGFRFSRVQ